MSEPTADSVAVATRIMRQLLGRRWTWPRRRAVEEYLVPSTTSRVALAGRPVREVISVTGPDGATLDHELSDGFRLDLPTLRYRGNFDWTVDRDAQGAVYPPSWSGRRGTPVRVEYTYGSPPPVEVQRAIDQLAGELDKAFRDQPCALPERVTSVSREGVSWTIIDPQTFLESGRTGLYYPDLVISMYPKAKVRARTFSAEHLPPRRLSSVVDTESVA